MSEASGDATSSDRRVVKRYANRKLYDTKDSRYVTLPQIAELIRAGEDVRIIDNATKEDKTDVTLALIISEELKGRPHAVPVTALQQLIRSRGKLVLRPTQSEVLGRPANQIGVGSKGEAELSDGTAPPAAGNAWQQAVDERIRAALSDATGLRDLREQLRSLKDRLARLEAKFASDTSKPKE